MSADADHWWKRRREASARSGDAWSGGGRAYRDWMGAEPVRDRPAPPEPASAQAGKTETTPVAGQGWRPRPRARRSIKTSRLRRGARLSRSAAVALLTVFVGAPLAWSGRRVRLRATFGLGAAGLAAVIFLAPLAWAGRSHPCVAAELALTDAAVDPGSRFAESKRRVANWSGPDGELFSRGQVGRQIAAEEHAGWPSFLGCTALFWRVRSEGGRSAASTPS